MTNAEVLARHRELFMKFYDAATNGTPNKKEFVESLSDAEVGALMILFQIYDRLVEEVSPSLTRIAIKRDIDEKSYYELQGIDEEGKPL